MICFHTIAIFFVAILFAYIYPYLFVINKIMGIAELLKDNNRLIHAYDTPDPAS